MPRFDVHRSTVINAAPERVFETVSDFGTWTSWSPWLCAEPDAKVSVSEDSSSVGSLYSWKGEIVGEGEIEHRNLQTGRLIEDEIRFVKPFRSRSDVAFEMSPSGESTQITWRMRGSLPWFLFWMRPQMEVFIGMDYERGLRMLKEWIETGEIQSRTTIRGIETAGPLRMAGIRRGCTLQDIGPSMEATFAEAGQKFSEQRLPTEEAGISVYHEFDLKTQTCDYTGGFLLPESSDSVPQGMSAWSIPAMQALCVEHIGRYDHLGNAWSAAQQYARYKKLKQSRVGTFELYKNDPQKTPPKDLRTEIFLPLK